MVSWLDLNMHDASIHNTMANDGTVNGLQIEN